MTIVNPLYGKTTIFQNKKVSEILVYTFANLLNVWLSRRQWILTSASVFSLLF